MSKTDSRIIFADVLKIISSFAVIIIHIAALKWFDEDVNIIDWKIMNFYDSISRFCVPIFVMITGMVLLDKIQ